MALSTPTRLVGDGDPAADMNVSVLETNRIGAIVDGPVATFLNAVDVTTDARTMGVKDVVTPPAVNPVSAVKVYSQAGTLKVRNPAGDVLALDGQSATYQPGDHGLLGWTYDPAITPGNIQPVSGTIYLCAIPVRKTVTVSTVWFGVGTVASGVTAGQTKFGLVSPAGVVLSSGGAGTAVATLGAQGVTLAVAQSCPPGVYWAALLVVATTMPFLARSTGTLTVLNANLAASAYRFATNGTAQTTLPASFTLASNSQAAAIPFWAAVS